MSGHLVQMPVELEWDGDEWTVYFGFDPGSGRIADVHVGPQDLPRVGALNELAKAVCGMARAWGLDSVRRFFSPSVNGTFVRPLLDAWEGAQAKMDRIMAEQGKGDG